MSEYKSCPPDVDYIEVQGPAGPQGPQGLQGPKGVPGPAGPQGPQGLQGPEGCRGPKGDRGPRGEKGDPGRDGRDGAPGPQGPQGVEGPRGCKGNDGNVKFHELTQQQINMLRGERGPKGDPGAKGAKGDPGEPGVRGATGPRGEAGPRGETGPQGARGAVGPMGPQGIKGDPGTGGEVTENLKTDQAWSSQQVADYCLHGNVDWITIEEMRPNVADTENGYVRDLVIKGRTMTNLSKKIANVAFRDEDYSKIPLEKRYQTIYESENEFLRDTTYTFVCSMVFDEGKYPGQGEKVRIHYYYNERKPETQVGHADGFMEVSLKRGVVKIPVVFEKQVKKVTVELCHIDDPPMDPETRLINFMARDFMLLEGDWTGEVTPGYFEKSKGVGINEKAPSTNYFIEVETRGKNLIDESKITNEFYIQEVPGTREESSYLFAHSTNNETPGIIIYCKPNTDYTFSRRIKDSSRARLGIVGFEDIPMNGEPGEKYHFSALETNNDEVVGFRTTNKISVLFIYLANYGQGTKVLSDIMKDLQLEEGVYITPYEPYKVNTRRFIIPKQLKDGEELYWDKEKRRYMINTGVGEPIPTNNTDEHLIHTFNYRTYIYIKTKIPSVLKGDFPIKSHYEYYQKKEWTFNDKEENGWAYLPNGLQMQWKHVKGIGNSNSPKTVEFEKIDRILSVQITPWEASSGSNPQGMGEIISGRFKHDDPKTIEIWGTGSNKEAMVFAIGDTKHVPQPGEL